MREKKYFFGSSQELLVALPLANERGLSMRLTDESSRKLAEW
jgi:hypothetical protein